MSTGERDPRWCEPAGLFEQLSLAGGHVHRGAGALGELGDGEQVIEVPVGDEDRGAPGTEGRESQPDLRGVTGRIDDDGLPAPRLSRTR